jgi:DNA-binding CsgD family transcriptional regulator
MERLEVSALGTEDARERLRAAAADAPADVVAALVEIAAGNPLALRELPAGLSRDQRLGHVPINPAPALAEALSDAFETRLAALDPEARSATTVAAAAIDRELAPVAAACRALGIEIAALERAEAAGAVEIRADRISFAHPLIKLVAYDRAEPAERRRAHRALADQSDPDGRAWHLAAATVGPDPEVADLLEAAAHRAAARGAHSAAADALQRAVSFTVGRQARSRRANQAALQAGLAGDYGRCARLLASHSDVDDPLLRARIRHGLAVVRMTGGMGLSSEAPNELAAEADAVADTHPKVAAAMFADAALLAGTAGRFDLARAVVSRGEAILPEEASAAVRCQVAALAGFGAALAGDASEARPRFDRAGRLLTELDRLSPAIQSIVLGLHGRVCCGQERQLRAELERHVAMARETDTFGVLPYLLTVSVDVAYRTGDWEVAPASEALALAEEHGQGGILPFALVVRGRLLAARGETERARSDLDRGIRTGEDVGTRTVVNLGRSALGMLELGAGRAEEAVGPLEQVRAFADDAGLEDPLFVPWAADLVEAYARSGRRADAERISSDLDRRAGLAEMPLSLAVAARCRGLVADAAFAAQFEQALEHHRLAEAPFETARTLLAYGSRLHRARRRVDGRERLRAALETFDALGATPWSELTGAELRAAGAVRRDPVADPDQLTPQELRVARAVAEGATNKQVAARLFLSPKTIDFHLGRVYRKLDIHSRAELATLVARGALDDRAILGADE